MPYLSNPIHYFGTQVARNLICLKLILNFWPNTSPDPLSFMFVSDRSFKFLRFQIGPLSFEFVSYRSFKFLRFQIGHLPGSAS